MIVCIKKFMILGFGIKNLQTVSRPFGLEENINFNH